MRPVWRSTRDRTNLLFGDMGTVMHCRLQYWLAVVHPSGPINGSPSFCHVRWRDRELRGWLLGLTISRSNPSGSFSLIGRWWQTSSDQRRRLCHEAGSCVEYLRFILYWLGYCFHSGSRVWLPKSSARLCSAEDLMVLHRTRVPRSTKAQRNSSTHCSG